MITKIQIKKEIEKQKKVDFKFTDTWLIKVWFYNMI